MDLERGDTIDVEAVVDGTIELRDVSRLNGMQRVVVSILSPAEAGDLAAALLFAADEARAYVDD